MIPLFLSAIHETTDMVPGGRLVCGKEICLHGDFTGQISYRYKRWSGLYGRLQIANERMIAVIRMRLRCNNDSCNDDSGRRMGLVT